MLSDTSFRLLERLLDAPGPSGFETSPARIWRDAATEFADVIADTHGNSIATVRGTGGPTIMLAGHIDEIGVIIAHIDDEGFLYIAPIGGWDPQVLVGQRLLFQGQTGAVLGVVGKKPAHLLKPDEREKAAKFPDLWVDIGVSSRAEATALVSVGDAGVIDARLVRMPNDRIVSRSIDDRIGAFVVLEALRRYAAAPGAATVVAVATTQEEIGYQGGGASVSAARLAPAMAIVVDVTFASDHPTADKKEIGDHRLGGGPVLTRGSVVSPVAFRLLRDTAVRLEIPFTLNAAGRLTNTDADAIHVAREGVATALLSIPNRYMHSPNEMVALADLDTSATLIAETCRMVDATTDFTAR